MNSASVRHEAREARCRSGRGSWSCFALALRLAACSRRRRRAADRRRGAEAHRREVAALRRAAAGVRRQGQDQRQALDVRAARRRTARARSVLRFTAPAEVKGVALLVVNHPDRASDQWMWTPAIERDRRIALQDRSTRFFGTDFSFEDLEERDVNQYDYTLLGEETVDGAPCWKIQSTPKQSEVVAVHAVDRLDPQGQLRVRPDRELRQGPGRAPAELLATSRTSRASGPRGSSR